jgi:hypothetical protein
VKKRKDEERHELHKLARIKDRQKEWMNSADVCKIDSILFFTPIKKGEERHELHEFTRIKDRRKERANSGDFFELEDLAFLFIRDNS